MFEPIPGGSPVAPKTLNRDLLAQKLSEHTHISHAESENFIRVIEDIVIAHVADGGAVSLSGFGKFLSTTRKGRKGVNPRTLEPMDIPDVNVPKFVPGKTFKESVKANVTHS